MAEVDRGMDVGELKKLLVKSKTEPVSCAVGQDGKNAVMMLNKIKQGKALVKDLEDKFDDLKNSRFGTAFVDTDADPKLVILTLNRAAPGMGAKLKKTLKGTGFSKVRIQLEDGTVAEDVGEEDEEGHDQPEGGGQPQQAAEPATAGAPAQPQSQPEPVAAQAAPEQAQAAESQPEQQPQQPTGFDATALMHRLTDLVKHMAEVLKADPDHANDLKELAKKAQILVQRGQDEKETTAAVDALEAALKNAGQAQPGAGQPPQQDAAGQQPQQPDAAGQQPQPDAAGQPNGQQNGKSAQVLQKSRLAWVAARKKVEDEIGKLHDAMTQHYNGHGFGADLDKVFKAKIDPILTSLDQSLADKLDEVNKTTDPQQHDKLVGEARQIINKYETFLSSDQLIPQLDQNPFAPLQIQKTLTATLETLKKSIR
jgi:hypothetical protein